jgi:hypothetical protein
MRRHEGPIYRAIDRPGLVGERVLTSRAIDLIVKVLVRGGGTRFGGFLGEAAT